MSRKIFISYNHKDQAVALAIKEKLSGSGLEVLLDADRMHAGENIESFITACIKDSDATLSLISTNSLLSAWVAVETVATSQDEKIRNRQFIPCYIDGSFFDRDFTGKAMQTIEDNISEINRHMATALERGWGIEDLQSERSRYLKLKAALPDIIGKLRGLLCIDLAGEHFDAGMEKVLKALEQGQPAASDAKAPVVQATGSLNDAVKLVLEEGDRHRLTTLEKQLLRMQQLLGKYGEELDFETDPKRQMRYEREIETTQKSIDKIVLEIQAFNNH